MNNRERVRRALLFMPGDDWKKISKGAGLGADSIIMDMEDGIAWGSKQAARETIRKGLTSGEIDFGRSERLVRLNPVSSGLWADDIVATFPGRPDGYMLPKIESAADVHQVSQRLTELEQGVGLESGATSLLILIETARGVVDLKEIAESDARVVALAFGAEDLAASVGAVRTLAGAEVAYARSALVIYAAANGLQALDSPCIHLNDAEQLHEETMSAVELGYAGKLAIHPAQVAPIQEAFTPSDEAIEQAQKLIAAHEAHQKDGTGVFAFEGRMVDQPMIRAAERILAKADAAGKRVYH